MVDRIVFLFTAAARSVSSCSLAEVLAYKLIINVEILAKVPKRYVNR